MLVKYGPSRCYEVPKENLDTILIHWHNFPFTTLSHHQLTAYSYLVPTGMKLMAIHRHIPPNTSTQPGQIQLSDFEGVTAVYSGMLSRPDVPELIIRHVKGSYTVSELA